MDSRQWKKTNQERWLHIFPTYPFSVGFLPVRMQSLLSVRLGSRAALEGRVGPSNELESWYICADAMQNMWNPGP